jgi:hypothetical protein
MTKLIPVKQWARPRINPLPTDRTLYKYAVKAKPPAVKIFNRWMIEEDAEMPDYELSNDSVVNDLLNGR